MVSDHQNVDLSQTVTRSIPYLGCRVRYCIDMGN